MTLNNFWQLLAGLAIFLYGLSRLESALKQIAGRTFKLFLRKHTNNKLSAIFSGTVVTAILQSSSVVTLMVLSFVGAGIISMRNALAVVFGSNLGTTLDSWVVASLGFKLDIEKFSFPIIAIAGLGLIIFSNKEKLYNISKFLIGFGLLFLGLSFMKVSMESLFQDFDFTRYANFGNIFFVLIGFVITAIIQSSSATMVITLSALNTGAIPFETAVSVIIGSELGTSIKLILGSIGGIAAKKRVAFGNIIFNIVITGFAFLLMHPIILLINNVLGISDPLIGLVMFQTTINLSGVIIFFPFINYFVSFLEKRFTKNQHSATCFIQSASPQLPELSIDILEKETALFIRRAISLNMEAFHVEGVTFKNEKNEQEWMLKNEEQLKTYLPKYENLKQAEGEILSFYIKMNKKVTAGEDFVRLEQLVSSVRNAMYAAKGIKDVREDRKELSNSSLDIKYQHYKLVQSQMHNFYSLLADLLSRKKKTHYLEELVQVMEEIRTDYDTRLNTIYTQSNKKNLEKVTISTLLNLSREVYSSSKAILSSLKDFLLDPMEAEKFENMAVKLIK
ncbi:MAG: Na/Pi cotransporter family protein [Bacteroidia bacterium]